MRAAKMEGNAYSVLPAGLASPDSGCIQLTITATAGMCQGLEAPYPTTPKRKIFSVRAGWGNRQIKQSTTKERCFQGWIVFLTQY